MKKYVIPTLTIIAAFAIIIVTAWADYIERKDFDRMAKNSPLTQIWEYGGRWTDGFTIMFSGGIIISQIYVIIKLKNSK